MECPRTILRHLYIMSLDFPASCGGSMSIGSQEICPRAVVGHPVMHFNNPSFCVMSLYNVFYLQHVASLIFPMCE